MSKNDLPKGVSPGVWTVEDTRFGLCNVFSLHRPSPGATEIATVICDRIFAPDAHLAAAAPDLYRALVQAVDALSNPLGDFESVKAEAKRAIDKANGGNQ